MLAVVDQMVEAASRLFGVRGFAEDGPNRIDLPTVPVNVENAGELARYKKIFSRLRSIALSSDDSIALVMQIAATYKNT